MIDKYIRPRGIYEALKRCEKLSQSKWRVAVGELPTQFATKRRTNFKISVEADVWNFLRCIRMLSRKRTLSGVGVRLKPLPKKPGT